MYSNLYKSSRVIVNKEDARVIDNNALLEEKLNKVLHRVNQSPEDEEIQTEEGFTEGLEADEADALLQENGGAVIKNSALEAERDALRREIEDAKAELSDLQAQADSMIEDAKSQIGAMQMKAYEEAKNQGYQEGERLGRQEAEAAKKEYQTKKKELEADYEKMTENLEPEFIETLTGIYEHIFKVDLSRYHDLVASLLMNAIQKVDSTRTFLIHVSREDYEGVLANKETIRMAAGGNSASVEFVDDATLSHSQCFIETENGIYDCSLDTQLSELSRKLKLLSYVKE